MEIRFNPADPADVAAVLRFLGEAPQSTPAPDARDPASVFAPLGGVPSLAGATAFPIAPAGPQAGALVFPPVAFPTAMPDPAAVAPSAPAGPASHVPGVELDTQGIPWDHRIHASTKSKTKGGEWTKLRGMNDEAKYNAIVAELKAAQAVPQAPVQLPGAPAGVMVPPAAALTLPLPTFQTATPQPPTPPAPPAAAAVPQNFDELMPRITAAVAAGSMPENALLNAVVANQLPGILALIGRPDYVPHIWAHLKSQYPALV